MIKLLLAWLSFAAMLAQAVWLGRRIDTVRPMAARGHLLYVPSGAYLTHACAGFRNLTADAMYLWAIQYAADESLRGQEKHLPRVFDVITDLDPRFHDAYFTGAFILAADAGQTEEALSLLDKGFRVRRRFEFPYDAGFYCFLYLKDYDRASTYFRRATEVPGCPIYVTRLALGMTKLVRPRDAYDLYRTELGSFRSKHSPDAIERDEQKKRHERLMRHRIMELEIALEVEELGRLLRGVGSSGAEPRSLEELRRLLRELGMAPVPLEPGNDPFVDPLGYEYEIRDGKVAARAAVSRRG